MLDTVSKKKKIEIIVVEKCFNSHISQISIKRDGNSTQRELARVTLKSRNGTGGRQGWIQGRK